MKKFIPLVLILVIPSTSKGSSPHKKKVEQTELRVALPSYEGLGKIDPHFLVNATQSVLAANIYSSLLDIDLDNGEIVGGLAKKFYWDKNELVLNLRDEFRSSTGLAIDTDDVNLSLKRMILINRRNKRPIYGRLDHLLCPNFEKISDVCQNVKIVDKLTIRLTFPRPRPEFVETVAGKPLYILPRSSFDNQTFELKHHRDSTGAYFASDENDTLVLNQRHWAYNSKSPHKLRLINEDDDSEKTANKFFNNQVDFITGLSNLGPKEYEVLQNKVKDSEIFRTNELSSTLLIYTNRGMKLPPEVRQGLSRAMLQSVRKYKQNLLKYRLANSQYLVPGGFGSLTEEMLKAVGTFIDQKSSVTSLPKLKIGIHPGVREVYRTKIWHDLDKVFEYIDLNETIDFENKSGDDEAQPHLYFVGTDISFYERFALISFIIKREVFNIRGKAADPWLDTYMAEPIQGKREEILRNVHFDSLILNPSFIPLFTKPYLSIVGNGWKIKFSKNSSLFYFNRIVRE